MPQGRPVQDRCKSGGSRSREEIRSSCVGKENSLFIGHPDAGWLNAVICSLLITALRCYLDPTAWLTDALRRILTCTPANQPVMLPWN